MKSKSIIARIVVLACFSVLVFSGAAISQHHSWIVGEKEVPMGKGGTTWWLEDDGVNPGRAGCHIEVRSQTDMTRTGRSFGEWCENRNGSRIADTLNATGPILVETGPEAGVHDHPQDVGHPKLVDCNAWCKSTQRKTGGMCMVVAGPAPCATSAICTCK